MKAFLFLALMFPTWAWGYFYPDSYIQSRDHFNLVRSRLKENVQKDLAEISLRVPSDSKEMKLTIDGLYMKQESENPERLLIITSGIHGVEAFTGAAIQFEYLEKVFKKEYLKDMGVLVLHSINPYGFHFKRRVDEYNIDLNRNFSANPKNFERVSKYYEDFESYINPTTPVNAGTGTDINLFLKSLMKLVTHGRKVIAQVAVGGQYQNPKGIYYGGDHVQHNALVVEQVFHEIGKPYKKILHIDLHTGYGQRGTLHFFSSRKATQLAGFSEIFKGFKIDAGSDDDFYTTSGDFSTFTMNIFKDKEVVIPMTFEFGTMDSQTTMGGFYSLRNMIQENQGHQHGYSNKYSEKRVKTQFMEMFNPSDKVWRDKVLKEGPETLKTVTERFATI